MRKPIPKQTQATVFQRDKWTCRYCGDNVIFSPALKVLDSLSPEHGYYSRNGSSSEMSPMLLSKCACVDHINPVADGGTNEINNLVCACWKCNTEKSNNNPDSWISRMINIEDVNAPIGWDGMLSFVFQYDEGNEWLQYISND